jgi:hypothetical protein
LLGRGLEKESSASYAENGKHIYKNSLVENYELKLRRKNESQSTGEEHVYHIQDSTQSHVFEDTFRVGIHGLLRRKPQPVLESTYRMMVELDPSLIPICAISYHITDNRRASWIFSKLRHESFGR